MANRWLILDELKQMEYMLRQISNDLNNIVLELYRFKMDDLCKKSMVIELLNANILRIKTLILILRRMITIHNSRLKYMIEYLCNGSNGFLFYDWLTYKSYDDALKDISYSLRMGLCYPDQPYGASVDYYINKINTSISDIREYLSSSKLWKEITK